MHVKNYNVEIVLNNKDNWLLTEGRGENVERKENVWRLNLKV